MDLLKILIVREWTQVFLKTFVGLYLLITNANIISELSRGMAPFKYILIHHFLDTPRWIIKILPVACLIATLFGLNNLRRKNELVAIFASGFGLKTFVLTILQLSLIVCFVQFITGAYVAPFAKYMRPYLMKGQEIHFRINKSKGVSTSFADGLLWYKGPNYFASFTAFDKSRSELRDLTIHFFDPSSRLTTRVVKAKRASYKQDHIWQLDQAQDLGGLKQHDFSFKLEHDNLHIQMQEKPEDFRYLEADISKLNIVQMYKYISNVNRLGIKTNEYSVILYQIFSQSILCIIFALTPLFALFSPNRRSASFGKNVFFTIVFVIVFWLAYSVSLSFGSKGSIYPFVAVFLVPILQAGFVGLNIYKHRELQ